MNPLIVNVDQIEEAAQPWEADLSREFLDEALAEPPPSEFRADGAAHVRATLTKLGREVLVRGKATVPLQGTCKRCLKPLHVEEPVEFTLDFVPVDGEQMQKRKDAADTDEEGPKGTFELRGLDEETYSGKEIDLSGPLREQVLLNLPGAPLCTDDCKGLCPACGKDLNEGDCGHRPDDSDPRWAALKNIQLDKKE